MLKYCGCDRLLETIGLIFGPTIILCDSSSAISLTKNHVLHARTKHIDVRHHFLWDHVDKKDIFLDYIETSLQLADIFHQTTR